MSEELISIEYLWGLFRKNIRVFLITALGCFAVAAVATVLIPRKYKSIAELSIQASYFQNPLVSDLIAEVHDPAELLAQRSALLRLALTDDFLDQLGEHYKDYSSAANEPRRLLEREELLEDIEYFPLGAATFQISVISSAQSLAFEKTTAVLQQMVEILIRQRYQKLLTTRDAIRTHLDSLDAVLTSVQVSSNVNESASKLRSELEKLDSEHRRLLLTYTERHPKVKLLSAKRESLRLLLENIENDRSLAADSPSKTSDEMDFATGFSVPIARASLQDIYNDLLKKLNYLQVVLEIEKDKENFTHLAVIKQPSVPAEAFFPNVELILVLGAVIGIVAGVVQVVYLELKRGAFISTESISDVLGVPLLGDLPAVRNGAAKHRIENSYDKLRRKGLPHHSDKGGDRDGDKGVNGGSASEG